MRSKQSNPKSSTISLIRAIAMSMIILCHILQGEGSFLAFWFNLGVQIFFFMSGFLYGSKPDGYIGNKARWCLKQFSKILVPYILLVIIILCINVSVYDTHYSTKEIIVALTATHGITGGGVAQLNHTWFISYILICYLITPFLFHINIHKSTQKHFLIAIGLAALAFCFIDYFRLINLNMAWLFNYILGFYFARFYTTSRKNHKTFKTWLLVLAATAFSLKIAIELGITPAFSANTSLLIHSWTHITIGSAIFVILYDLFNKINIKYRRVFKFSDTYSYHIYLVHQIFILGSFSIITAIPNKLIGIPLAIIAAATAGANLYYLSWFLKDVLWQNCRHFLTAKLSRLSRPAPEI